jgi:hypothetical protein
VCLGERQIAERLIVRAGRREPPLAHDFSIQLGSGLYPVASAGTRLPYRASFQLVTAGQGRTVPVRLFEGLVPIGGVTVEKLPAAVTAGTSVEVTVEFQVGWTIAAEAVIPSADASAHALIEIPQRVVPGWRALRGDYTEARNPGRRSETSYRPPRRCASDRLSMRSCPNLRC